MAHLLPTQLAVTVIVTVLEESHTIKSLLQSLVTQTHSPTEIIIIDGGSQDSTVAKITEFRRTHAHPSITVKVKKGNRSVGRNYAISLSSTPLIACTDAGCIPDADWLEQLLKVYTQTQHPVVAGYYVGSYQTDFERAVIPYALVMPDALPIGTFLPATRSLLMEKQIWQRVGGFHEALADNEDYEFAKRIDKVGIPIAFARHALVTWQPRSTLREFFWMIFRFARGDIQAHILRPKVVLLYARYLVGVILFIFLITQFSVTFAVATVGSMVLAYLLWAVQKNARYVGKAWYWLPILQITADVAVLAGSTAGFTKPRIQKRRLA